MQQIYSVALALSMLVATVAGHAGHHGSFYVTGGRTYGASPYLTRDRSYGTSSYLAGDRTYENKSFLSSILNQPPSRAYQRRVTSAPYAVNSFYGTSNKVEAQAEEEGYVSNKVGKSVDPIGIMTQKDGSYTEKGTHHTPVIGVPQPLTQISDQHIPKLGSPQPLVQMSKDIDSSVDEPGFISPIIQGKDSVKPAKTYSPTDEKFVVSSGTNVEDLIVVGTVTDDDAPAPPVMRERPIIPAETFPEEFPSTTADINDPVRLRPGFVDPALNDRTVGISGDESGISPMSRAGFMNPVDSENRNVWSRQTQERRVPLNTRVWPVRTRNRSPIPNVQLPNTAEKKLTKYDRLRRYEGR